MLKWEKLWQKVQLKTRTQLVDALFRLSHSLPGPVEKKTQPKTTRLRFDYRYKTFTLLVYLQLKKMNFKH